MNGDLQVVMMSREGSEPRIYDATFALRGGGGAMKPRRLVGDDQLRRFLEELAVTDIDGFMEHSPSGRFVVREITVTLEQAQWLGLA